MIINGKYYQTYSGRMWTEEFCNLIYDQLIEMTFGKIAIQISRKRKYFNLFFQQNHIKNPDWRYREASLMAFGAILEGPDPTNLKPLVEEAMPMLIQLMKEDSVAVKDTAAWTIGRVCELVNWFTHVS